MAGEHDTNEETCLVGTLDSWPLIDVLSWLHKTQRTAMVRVGPGLNAGVIFLQDGFIYRCEWQHLAGPQALLALTGVTVGPFSVIQRELPRPQPNIFVSTEQLLLECAASWDEQRRNAG